MEPTGILKRKASANGELNSEEPPIYLKQKTQEGGAFYRNNPNKKLGSLGKSWFMKENQISVNFYKVNKKGAKPEGRRPFLEMISNLQQSLSLSLKEGAPKKPYEERPIERKKMTRFMGSRKDVIAQIHFLTCYGHLCEKVIYVGGAPGTFIPLIADLFPNHLFILFDPNPFSINETERIEIINEIFTDQIAETIEREHNGNYLFISDIRTRDRELPIQEQEFLVQKDNNTQRKWIDILHPARSMLRFRCPYPNTVPEVSTVFFEGTMLLSPWGNHSSAEIKIIPCEPPILRMYNHKEYESELFYHNDVTRIENNYEQPVSGGVLTQKYDGGHEVLVLYQYLKKFPLMGKGKSLPESIKLLSQDISDILWRGNVERWKSKQETAKSE